MGTDKNISVALLQCDTDNPRIAQEVATSRDAIRAIWRMNEGHQLALAEDIVRNGLSPIDRLLVRQADSSFVVLEGNRRTSALKALHNPELVLDVVSGNTGKRLRAAASKKAAIPKTVDCHVVDTATDDADFWVQRRHQGVQQGAGLVSWGAIESARFKDRRGKAEDPTLAVLKFVFDHGTLDPGIREKLDKSFNFTNYKRIVEGPLPRRLLGLDYSTSKGRVKLKLLGPEDEVVKGWQELLRRVLSGLNVREIISVEKALVYLEKMGQDHLPDPAKMSEAYRSEVLPAVDEALGRTKAGKSGEKKAAKTGSKGKSVAESDTDERGSVKTAPASSKGGDSGKGGAGDKGKKGASKTGAKKRTRTKLIPGTCSLSVRPDRVRDVYVELQKLPAKQYPNAVSVLFRVFVELSVDVLHDEVPELYTPPPGKGAKANWDHLSLRIKLDKTVKWLGKEGLLSDSEAKAAKLAFSNQKLNSASVEIMNAYVHNTWAHPDPESLKTGWDNISPFMDALWNRRPRPDPES